MTIDFEDILNVSDNLVELVRNWRNSTYISQYMITNHTITKEEHRRWIEHLKTKKNSKVWILKYNRKPVGLVSLSDIDYLKKTTEWGFYIADESLRGKGIGSQVLYKLMEYVFDEMNFHKMSTMVLANNLVAIHLYEKFYFRKEGVLPKQLVRKDKRIDVFFMGITQVEWNRKKYALLEMIIQKE